MKRINEVQKTIEQIISEENDSDLVINQQAIEQEISKSENLSLPIKIIAIIGGFFASLALIAFLFVSELIQSETTLIITGIILIILTIAGCYFTKKLVFTITSISIYISGLALLVFGLIEQHLDTETICLTVIILSILVLFITQNYIYSFVSLFCISASLYTLVMISGDGIFLLIFLSLQVAILTYLSLNEGKVISYLPILNKLYNVIKIVLILSIVAGLCIYTGEGANVYNWMLSLVIIALIVYSLNSIFEVLDVTLPNHKLLYSSFAVIILLPTIFSPEISCSLLIILLCFYTNYKTGLVIGILSLVASIINYYYSLEMTLLNKSIILMVSGTLFIGIYLFIHKKLSSNEKI